MPQLCSRVVIIAVTIAVLIAVNLLATPAARAAVIFETASQGPAVTDIFFQPVMHGQMSGVRFFLSEPALVTHLGGHLLSDSFPARHTSASLVALTDANDVPDSVNRTTPDFLATTTLFPTTPSSDIEAEVAPVLILPGWYGLVIGDIPGNPAGVGAYLVLGNTPIGSATFFTAAGSEDAQFEPWFIETDVRMYVKGVPEPTGAGLFALSTLLTLRRVRRQECRNR